MGLEATSWEWLRDGIRRTLPAYSLLERVENRVGDGTADVNYVLRGAEGWIELKAVDLPKRESTPVLGERGLRVPSQVNWHVARHAANGRTWIFVTAKPYRWLVNGVYAKQINNWTREEFCLRASVWYDENWTPAVWKKLVHVLSS